MHHLGQVWLGANIGQSIGTLTLSNEEVKHSDDDCVSAEHVVSTGVDACQGHPTATPDSQRPL